MSIQTIMTANSPGKAPRIGKYKWMVPVIISLSGTANYFGYVLPRPILPALQSALASGPQDHVLVKFIMTGFIVGVIFGSSLAGFFLERFTYRIVLVCAGLIFVATGCSGYLISDLRVFIASRIISGAAAGALNITAITMAGDLYRDELRARWIGVIAAAASFSLVVSSPLAGLVGNANWRMPFLLNLLELPIVVLAMFMGRIDLPRTADAAVPLLQSKPRFPKALLLVGAVVGVFMTLPSIYLAFRMHDIGVISAGLIGSFFLALNIPETITAAFYGAIRRRISASAIFFLGFSLVTVGLTLVAFFDTRASLLGGMFIFGPGIGLLNANMTNVAAGISIHRSRVVGLVLSAYCVGSVIGLLLLEYVFRNSNADRPLFSLAAFAAASALYCLLINRRRFTRNAAVA
jgi:predicted MFS family arabinose efflux permease